MTSSNDSDAYQLYPERHRRRSIRLQNYDYSRSGHYFITLCINDRWMPFFGDVVDGKMVENRFAEIVRQCWMDLPNHYHNIALDAFVIMPNHVHGIIHIRDTVGHVVLPPNVPTVWTVSDSVGAGFVGAGFKPAPTDTCTNIDTLNTSPKPTIVQPVHPQKNVKPHGLPEFVRALKTFSSRRINECGGLQKRFTWQRNYWEHIVRNTRELITIRKYIINNPVNWQRDRLNSTSAQAIRPVSVSLRRFCR